MPEPKRISAEVTVFTPLLTPMRYKLGGGVQTIGRSADCSIPIRDRYLSRRHAELHAAQNGGWIVRDLGSANGTYVNGHRLARDYLLRSGDRIRLGDTEIVYQVDHTTDRLLAVGESKVSAKIAIPVNEIEKTDRIEKTTTLSPAAIERLRILNALAGELIEDRPLDQLFGFIVERVMEHLRPSRTAIGLLADNGTSFASVEVRRSDQTDASDLVISHTLLAELVEEKKALAFFDVSEDEKLSQAKSIIMQGIHSVLCAPMMIGDRVVGVLYVDFLFTQRQISEEDVRLVAQIARFAGMKLETTRLREESMQKRLMDEELRTAYMIQKGLLPDAPPVASGFTFEGRNRPCKTVSGDYYDFVERPDGKIYFVIADVSGKGITAALIMAGLQASFRIFTKSDPTPGRLLEQINSAIHETIPRSKFITVFAGRLDPTTGLIEFANAGHTPPVWINAQGSSELSETDLLLGMKTEVEYRDQKIRLSPGEALLLFTDGITEAETIDGVQLGTERLHRASSRLLSRSATEIGDEVEGIVFDFTGGEPLEDDLTLLVIARDMDRA